MTAWDDRLPGVPARDAGPAPLDPELVSDLADLLHPDRVADEVDVDAAAADDVAPMLLLLLDD